MKTKISADLDKLIKRASEVKADGLKKVADTTTKLENAPDGTSPATTGEHAAQSIAEAGKITASAVDGGGKDNPENGSIAKNTDGSAAAAVNGQKGPTGGDFPVKSEADNGTPANTEKYAGVRKLAKDLRAAAESMLTGMDRFLVKAARASTNPKVKTAAEGAPDDQVASQASDALMEQIAAGKVSDEDAAQILQEAVSAGAVTPEELQQAAALAHQAGGGDAGAGDPSAPPAGTDAAAMPNDAPSTPPAPPADAGGMDPATMTAEDQLKMAAAKIGPDHPKYIEKLAALHSDDMEAGYKFFNKLAEVLTEEEKKDEKKEDKKEDKEQKKEEKAVEKTKVDDAPKDAAVVTDKPAELVDSMSGINLKPADEAEKQALAAVQQELGLDDGQLAHLAATPVPSTQDKVASAKAKYRAAIMAKVAALQK